MYDRSDARGRDRGSGVGYAPTPVDGRDENADASAPSFSGGNRHNGVSPAVLRYATDEQESDRNVPRAEDGNPFSGAQNGSPAFMYPLETRTGMLPLELSPIDGGMSDPIRDGDNPSRRPFSRFLVTVSKWWEQDKGDFTHKDRVLAGSAIGGPKAAQPRGRMSPMDEYRLMSDGGHA